MAVVGTSPQEYSRRFGEPLVSPAAAAVEFILSSEIQPQLPRPIDAVVMGLSGLFGSVHRVDHRDAFEHLRAALGIRELIVCDDATTAFFGAVGPRAGVVSAVGTGIVTMAWDGDREYRRVDGWGWVGGDAGSGFWIGSRGAWAALEMADGRRKPSSILESFMARYGSPAAFSRVTVLEQPPKSYVADFAIDVLDLAEAGDAVALAISEQAATEIVRSIRSAEDQLGMRGPPVCLAGKMAGAGEFLERLIHRQYIACGGTGHWEPSGGTPLDGAACLISRPDLVERLSPDHVHIVR